jgi:hypothetical protein
VAGRHNEPAYLTVEHVKVETEKALLCVFEDGREEWIPKKLIGDDSEVREKGDAGEIAIPLWLAEEKKLL